MKKIVVSLAVFLSLSSQGFADPVVAQSYHSSTDASPTSVQSAPTQTPATVSDSDSGAALINSTSADAATTATDTTQNAQQQAQLMQWQAKVDQHLQNLDASNQAIRAEIQSINQSILVLQQQVMASPSQNDANSGIFSKFSGKEQLLIAGGALAIILLLIGVLIGRLSRRSKPSVIVQHAQNGADRVVGDVLADDTKSEYDFMGSREAIPAKLDLARSYITMRDYDQAKTVLQAVLASGDDEQRSEAESLLKNMQTA